MGLPRKFNRAMLQVKNAFAAWPPVTNGLRLGDYGVMKDGVFVRKGNIEEFGVQVEENKALESSTDVKFARGGATVTRSLAGAAVNAFPATDVDAELSFSFAKRDAMYVDARKMTLSGLSDLTKVSHRLRDAVHSTEGVPWNRRWLIIHQLEVAENPIVLVSSNNETDVTIAGSASALEALEMGFAAGTPVHTPGGPRAIDSLLPGDLVWAWSFSQAAVVARRVTQLHRHRTLHWMELSGTGGGEVRATSAHRFYDATRREWTDAASLKPGMCLLQPSGRSAELHAVRRVEIETEAASYNLSIDADCTYFVGPGWLVHNEPVDVGLGGQYVIYRGTNPNYPGKVYIGQAGELDANGRPRGAPVRQGEHRTKAAEALRLHEEGTKILSPEQKEFFEFMQGVELEPIVEGIATEAQAKYLEQLNMDIERMNSDVELMNRREEIVSSKERIEAEIRNDPRVRAKGYCP